MPKTLTENAVKAALPPAVGAVTILDGSLKNFGLRVSQGGTKTFFVLLGKGRRQKIGSWPIISLALARTEAKILLAQRTLGKLRPTALAFDDAKEKFLAQCVEENKPRTVLDYRRLLNRHFPFKRQPLADITSQEVMRRIDRITAPAERRYAFVVARIFFNWALKKHYIQSSPMIYMEAPAIQTSRDRFLTDGELTRVWIASEQCGTFGVIVKLLILTGQRRGEIAALQADWIEALGNSEHLIALPAWLTKNNREHRFPIGSLASDLLQRSPTSNGTGLIFPAKGAATPFNGWSKSKATLDKLSGVIDWTLHDLRRTFATGLAALGTPIHVTEKLLNHVSGTISGVAAIYNRHQFWHEQVQAVNAWEDHLSQLLKQD